MNNLSLYKLLQPITIIPGVGPQISDQLGKLLQKDTPIRLIDILKHLPMNCVKRPMVPSLKDVIPQSIVTVKVNIDYHLAPKVKRQPYRVYCSDESGQLTITFFQGKKEWWAKLLPAGQARYVSGKIEASNENLNKKQSSLVSGGTSFQMTHPDFIFSNPEKKPYGEAELVYPAGSGLKSSKIAQIIQHTLPHVPELPEWIDSGLIQQNKWPSWHQAIFNLHQAGEENDLLADAPARERLAYDELLAGQLALGLIRLKHRRIKTKQAEGNEQNNDSEIKQNLINEFKSHLPFTLTNAQDEAYEEIQQDLSSPYRMLRLIQGDVGSGKTVVALMAMLSVVEQGGQTALMVPTDLLARQHYQTIEKMCEGLGLNIALLTGKQKGKKRESILEGLSSGNINIVIGTHALFQKDVHFKNLKLAVIDEQHRFGVHQRLMLSHKGEAVHLLVMTATPIPRTLLMLSYGDIDVSYLNEKPAGRLPITTRLISKERIIDVVQGLDRALKTKQKIYWICPLVEESEKLDLAAAEERFAHLSQFFPGKVGLVHGRMKEKEKNQIMDLFNSHGDESIDLLVSTTVVEVGVDVKEATIMVIEHAERFGLAQLHQLRGRIGRNDKPSTCLLMYGQGITSVAQSRLKIMRESNDGFRIAEEDLKLRGSGEVLGTRQSGLPKFSFVDFDHHKPLLSTSRKQAQKILETDQNLQSKEGQHLRFLLEIFNYTDSIEYLKSG